MSRLFNGSTDLMTFAPVDWAFGTILIVAKIVTTTDLSWLSFIEGEASAGDLRYALGRHNSGVLYTSNHVTISTAVTAEDADGWAIYAVTKATGTAAPTLHKLPIAGTRTSTAGSVTLADAQTLGAGRIKLCGDDDPANMKVAAFAIFNGTVLTGAQIDGIESARTTQSIADLSPTELWDDSDAFATGLIAGTLRTAISGTTDDVDDPASWVYGLGGGGDATVTAVPADGTGDFPAPVVSADSTVTAPPADGTGDFPASEMNISSTVETGPMSGTGTFPPPVVSGETPGPAAPRTRLPSRVSGVTRTTCTVGVVRTTAMSGTARTTSHNVQVWTTTVHATTRTSDVSATTVSSGVKASERETVTVDG